MPDTRDYTQYHAEAQRRCDKAVDIRISTIHSQLALAITFCNTADVELLYDEAAAATDLLNRATYVASEMRQYLGDPSLVPHERVAECQEELWKLERETEKLAARFTKPGRRQ